MVNEFHAVVEELGGKPALGRSLETAADLRTAIREGFPQSVVEEVMHAAGLTLKELATTLDLSARSLRRRRREGRLARYESDRLYRLARIVALAKYYLGDGPKANRWLKRPNRALGGSAPLELVDTELGARTVENILGRIADGGVSRRGSSASFESPNRCGARLGNSPARWYAKFGQDRNANCRNCSENPNPFCTGSGN